jgi:hypothetical protein
MFLTNSSHVLFFSSSILSSPIFPFRWGIHTLTFFYVPTSFSSISFSSPSQNPVRVEFVFESCLKFDPACFIGVDG